uniref:Family with sequence similarity 83 member A n=1 Tax=Latimeria chalumnae TaxID=7897 RepID=H3AM77_LATCH
MYRPKHVGKIKKRLQEVKHRWTKLSEEDFSYSESARLATDALLSGGIEAYQRVLNEEGEVDFLSPSETQYMIENVTEPNSTTQDYLSGESEETQTSDDITLKSDSLISDCSPPALAQGWPMYEKKYYFNGTSKVNVHFQTDRSINIKDTIRQHIKEANKVLAIIMDMFTDIEIFCDLLEATNKRLVPVYLLLDERNLKHFSNMCDDLHITGSHLKNFSIRSVSGNIYCSKTGKKVSGQIQEKVIIIDCEYVLAGSYSFTWLSAHVHRHFITRFSGYIVKQFDEEFHHLYALSKPVIGSDMLQKNPMFLQSNTGSSMASKMETSCTPSDTFNTSYCYSGRQSKETLSKSLLSSTSPLKMPAQRTSSFHDQLGHKLPPRPSYFQAQFHQRNYTSERPAPAILFYNFNTFSTTRVKQKQ